MSLLKVGGSAGITPYLEVSDAGVLTLTDGTNTRTITPGAAEPVDRLIVDDSPTLGAEVTIRQYASAVTTLDTGDASTAITVDLPAGALVTGAALKVTTTIAGIDSTTGTLALTGGSTATLGTISAFSAGTKGTFAAAAATTAATQASFVLSGGADNTPSAGAVQLVVSAIVQAALD